MLKVTILIDGGYLRKAASPVYRYNPDFMAYRCREISEKLKRELAFTLLRSRLSVGADR